MVIVVVRVLVEGRVVDEGETVIVDTVELDKVDALACGIWSN